MSCLVTRVRVAIGQFQLDSTQLCQNNLATHHDLLRGNLGYLHLGNKISRAKPSLIPLLRADKRVNGPEQIRDMMKF